MFKKIENIFTKHKKLFKYGFLPFCLILIFLLFFLPGRSLIQVELMVFAVISYVGLSLFYHHLDKSLTFEVALEYILIATLVTIIVVDTYFY